MERERRESASVYNRFSGHAGTERSWLEIGSRHHVHPPCVADLVAVDDVADVGDATRFARPDFLSTETRWTRWKTFSDLEVPDNEGERRHGKSRASFGRIDPR